ncbi:unnamed protein product [Paramecium sonneborni]|uniref:Uncharacterized protein n=1 Tax=Paramecium sonneborni TaxID=65129 RepID=A0A8S1NWB6_9CILI|nr:unnamed protein product [Paramecium sonneborni]
MKLQVQFEEGQITEKPILHQKDNFIKIEDLENQSYKSS